MVIRTCRNVKKYLGQRTRGGGNTKNRRGAGNRGGRGNAGRFKHKYSKFYTLDGTRIDLKPKSNEKAISIIKLNDFVDTGIQTGKIKDIEKGITIDFKKDKVFKKYYKVIGRKADYKFILKNVKSSVPLKKAVESKGGQVE